MKRDLLVGFGLGGLLVVLAFTPRVHAQGVQPGQSPFAYAYPDTYYNFGGVMLPRAVPGGSMGPGTINAEGIYLNGISITSAGTIRSGTLPVPFGGTGSGSFAPGLPLVGNGTGNVQQGTRSGTTTNFATVNGALATGDCVSVNGGDLVDSGAPCGGGSGGSGTVTSGTTGQLAYFAAAGTTLSGLNLSGLAVSGGVLSPVYGTTAGTSAQGNDPRIANAATAGANTNITSLGGLTTPLSTAQGGTGAASFAAGLPIFGNGTGAFQVGTISGTGTKLATVGGNFTSGNCVATSGGNLVDAGAPCGSGSGSGGGTVVGGAANQLAYYPGAGPTVSGLNAGSGLTVGGGALSLTPPVVVSTTPVQGDGSTTAFTLNSTVNPALISVSVGGVPQSSTGNYTSTSTVLTFTQAPPLGAQILVIYGGLTANLPALAASAYTDTTNASNVTSGTLPAAVLPAQQRYAFTGDGSTMTFSLTSAPVTISRYVVAIGGVLQDTSVCSLSTTQLACTVPPPAGVSVQLIDGP